jgi:hypothetical protein
MLAPVGLASDRFSRESRLEVAILGQNLGVTVHTNTALPD